MTEKIGKPDGNQIKIKMTEDEISLICQREMTYALEYHANLRDRFRKDYKLYRAKKFGNEKVGRSQLVSSDVFDVVEWILPDLLEVFSGNIFRVEILEQPDLAVQIEEAINNVFNEKPNGFIKKYLYFKDALIHKFSLAKTYARVEDKLLTRELPSLELEQMQALLADPFMKKMLNYDVVTEPDPMTGEDKEIYANIRFKYLDTSERKIKTDILSIDEYRFIPVLDEDGIPIFQAHAKIVNMDFLRRMERQKFYRNVSEIQPSITLDMQHYMSNAFAEDGLGQVNYEEVGQLDEARKPTEIWECYTKIDIDKDGYLEDVIVTMNAGDGVILSVIPNTVGNIFTKLTGCPDVHKFSGISIGEQLEDLQKLKSALMRHLVENIANVNYGFWRIDPNALIAVRDILRHSGFLRATKGQVERFAPQPLDNTITNTLEFFEGIKENRVGVTRYNQGSDAESLNRTATGIIKIMRAASKRVRTIALIFAQTGLSDLAQVYTNLYTKFILPPGTIPEGLKIKAWCEVGGAELDREDTIKKMTFLLQTLMGLAQTGLPLTTPVGIYNVLAKIVRAMGENPADYISKPEDRGFDMQQLQQGQQGRGQGGQKGQQGQPQTRRA